MSDFIHKVKEAVTGDKHDKHDKHDSHSAHNDSYDSNDANKPTPAYIVTAVSLLLILPSEAMECCKRANDT